MLQLPNNAYNENFTRGTLAFPFDYHLINHFHPRFVMPFHYHIDYELIRISKGGLSIALNDRHYYLKHGDFLFINKGVVHGGKTDGYDDVYECIVFNLDALYDKDRPSSLDLKKLSFDQIVAREHYNAAADPAKAQLLNLFFDTVRERNERDSLYAQGLLLAFIGKIISDGDVYTYGKGFQAKYLKHLNKANILFRYIFDNFSSELTLEDLAATVELSPKYFCRFFKDLTGKRPMEYLNEFRIDCAALKLSASEEPISQIAYDCGFNDPAYFTKLFKKLKGYAPKEYRAGHKSLRL